MKNAQTGGKWKQSYFCRHDITLDIVIHRIYGYHLNMDQYSCLKQKIPFQSVVLVSLMSAHIIRLKPNESAIALKEQAEYYQRKNKYFKGFKSLIQLLQSQLDSKKIREVIFYDEPPPVNKPGDEYDDKINFNLHQTYPRNYYQDYHRELSREARGFLTKNHPQIRVRKLLAASKKGKFLFRFGTLIFSFPCNTSGNAREY